jgi:hypothetical protein
MIAKSQAAALVVAGGALLGGCAQTPANYQPVASGYFDAAWAAQQQRAYAPPVGSAEVMARYRAYLEQQNARQYQPDDAPVAQAAPPPKRFNVHRAPANDISDNVPSAPAPVPEAPVDTDCVGWWRLCHFL